jgi:hypothetical protein
VLLNIRAQTVQLLPIMQIRHHYLQLLYPPGYDLPWGGGGYSNLGTNTMISKLWTTIQIQIQQSSKTSDLLQCLVIVYYTSAKLRKPVNNIPMREFQYINNVSRQRQHSCPFITCIHCTFRLNKPRENKELWMTIFLVTM